MYFNIRKLLYILLCKELLYDFLLRYILYFKEGFFCYFKVFRSDSLLFFSNCIFIKENNINKIFKVYIFISFIIKNVIIIVLNNLIFLFCIK